MLREVSGADSKHQGTRVWEWGQPLSWAFQKKEALTRWTTRWNISQLLWTWAVWAKRSRVPADSLLAFTLHTSTAQVQPSMTTDQSHPPASGFLLRRKEKMRKTEQAAADFGTFVSSLWHSHPKYLYILGGAFPSVASAQDNRKHKPLDIFLSGMLSAGHLRALGEEREWKRKKKMDWSSEITGIFMKFLFWIKGIY